MSTESGQAIIQSQCNTGWVNGSMGWSHPQPGLWRDENLYSKAFGSFGGVSDDGWKWWPCKIQVQNSATSTWHWHQHDINWICQLRGFGFGYLEALFTGEGFIMPIEPSRCYNSSMACSCSKKKTHVTLIVNVTSLLKQVACCIVQSTLVEKWFRTLSVVDTLLVQSSSVIQSYSVLTSLPKFNVGKQCEYTVCTTYEYGYVYIYNVQYGSASYIHIEVPLRGSTWCNCAPWLGAKAL